MWRECEPIPEYTGLCFQRDDRWYMQSVDDGSVWKSFEKRDGGRYQQLGTAASGVGPMNVETALGFADLHIAEYLAKQSD